MMRRENMDGNEWMNEWKVVTLCIAMAFIMEIITADKYIYTIMSNT